MVRTVVLGAGEAGERQARAFSAHAQAAVVEGPFDVAPEAAEPLLAEADAVVVALPDPVARVRAARLAIERGLDVLLEPPVGPSAQDARGLLGAIVRAPRRPIVVVGHAVFFDPAVRRLRELVEGQRVLSLQVEHHEPGWGAGRGPDEDVVRELMLDDLAVVLGVAGAPLATVQAAGRRSRRSGPIDHAHALLVFEDDLVASLVACHAGASRVRRVTVTTVNARIAADLDAGTVEAVRTTAVDAGGHERIAQRTCVTPVDAHVAQAGAFLHAVAHRGQPGVPLGTGIAAHEAAAAILKRIALVQHRPSAGAEHAAA